ncbi:Sterol uptake control protein 2 [Lasiodiplodia hormozganensis]|uniref:Sterol uptake control protein 2 n=1 Tax=Lasiodiplodia hormozganensis TaxID=869390 RepID=A0AA40CVG7_9PEZI|nr:Sterol uptake control protein 2 [Lasiodiplodia hormozganensis]
MADITDDAYRARRPHRKSRFGCKNCKSRKIKCDEEKPQCGQCTKHAVVCDFSTRESVPASSVSSSNTTATTSGINSALLNPETPTGTPPISHDDEAWHWRRLLPSDFDLASASSLNIATNNPIEPQLELNMTDLELLHHFTVTTAYTLSTAPELQTWWRIEVPHIAFSYPFVMRALLSLSGIHVAHTLRSSSSSSADNNTTATSPPSAIHPSLFPSASSSFSSSSVTSSSHNNNNHPEERRLKAADHINRALSQRDLALRTAHAVLPNCTTAITADGTSTSLSLNPHIFPPLYICAALTTLIAFASQRPFNDDEDSTAASNTDDPNDLLLLTIGDNNNNGGPGTVAPWLRLSRDIKHAVDSVVAAAEAGGGGGGGDGISGGDNNNIFNPDSSRNRTTLLMSNAVGMPLRIARSHPRPPQPPPPPQSPSPSPPPQTTTTTGGTFALRYDPCYGWSNGHSPGDDYGTGTGTGNGYGNSGNGDGSRASSRPRRPARETDPAVAAGTEELSALRRWFVALYEQRYHQHIGGAALSPDEDIAAAAEAAADKADLASLCAAIDALVEAYAAFDGRLDGGGVVVDSEDDMTVGMRAILGWACNSGGAGAGVVPGVDERFLERATQRAPAFLVVLAFWGVMVHWVDGGGGGGGDGENSSGGGGGGLGRQGGGQQQQRSWWIGGWGKKLVGRVEAAVSEQEAALESGGGRPDGGGSEVEDEVKRDWRRWLRWPLEQVGTEGERGRVRAVDCVVI